VRSRQWGLVGCLVLVAQPASAQSVERYSVDSAVSINKFTGENAPDQPDVVVDVTAAMRLSKGWTAYVRPWFRRPSSVPHEVAAEIYQAAVQYQKPGRIATRVDLGYILSPIGLGMLDMRPDTNPVIMSHMSYLIPMPVFEAGVPAALPIASSYPLGGQFTASTTKWDARAAIVDSPPNRNYVLYASSPNPEAHPALIVGGGITPKTGLRLGVGVAAGDYVSASEVTKPSFEARHLNMFSFEGEYAFGYTRLAGEVTTDSLGTASGHERATQWFIQGIQSLSARWFVSGRHEGADAPPRVGTTARTTLRIGEACIGYRLDEAFTIRGSFVTRKTYFTPIASQQVGVSLVWARRWW